MSTRGEPITTKFSIDISELKAGIQEANRQIKLANSEFKAASSGMEDWGNTADGLQAKLKQLTTVHDAEVKKLELLQKQYKAVAEEQGENSTAAQNLLIKINNQQAAVNKTASEIGKYEKQLNSLEKASSEAADSVDEQKTAYEQLENTISDQENALSDLKRQYSSVVLEQGKSSKEAKDLAKQIKTLSGDLNENKSEMNKAETAADKFDKTLDDLGESANDAGEGFTVFKGALATFAGNILTSAAGAIRDIGSNILGLAESTREYRGEMAKLSTAAQDNGYEVNFAKAAYMDLYGVLGDETAATTTVSNFMAMGTSTETLNSLLNSSIGIWAKYGDSIPLDGLAESVNESSRVAQVTGTLADALNWAGISEDDFNTKLEACSSEQERQQLIADTLSSTYGSLSAAYQEANESTTSARKAQAALTDSLAQVGEKVEPVTTAVTRGFSNLLSAALELTDGLDMTSVLDGIEAGFSVLIQDILPKVIEGFQWIITNKDQLIAGIQAIATGFLAFKSLSFITSIVTTISGLVSAVTGASGALGILQAVIAAMGGPVTIVIGVITALVAAFTYLWNTSDGFRNFWITLWNNIVSFCSASISTIVNFFTVTVPGALTTAQTFIMGIVTAIVNFFTVTIPGAIDTMVLWFQMLPERILSFLTMVLMNVTTWVSNMADQALQTGEQFLNNVVTFFQQLPERVGYFIGYTLTTVVLWVVNMINKAREVGSEFLNNVINFFQQLPGKAKDLLTKTWNNVVNWGTQTVNTGKQKASEFLNAVVSFVQQLPGKIWNFLSQCISNVVNWGTQTVNTGRQKASEFLSAVVNFIQQLPGRIASLLSNVISNVISWGSNMVSQGTSAARNMASGIVGAISSLPGQVYSIGSNIVHGIWNGISGAAGWLYSQVRSFASGIISGIKGALGIASPSKVMRDEVGKWIPAGVGEGITKNVKPALKSIKNMTKKMTGEAQLLQDAIIPDNIKASLSSTVAGMKTRVASAARTASGAVQQTKEIIFNQYNNSPKALSRLDIYRQTKSQLFSAKGRLQSV